jgi:hypothetical protein
MIKEMNGGIENAAGECFVDQQERNSNHCSSKTAAVAANQYVACCMCMLCF